MSVITHDHHSNTHTHAHTHIQVMVSGLAVFTGVPLYIVCACMLACVSVCVLVCTHIQTNIHTYMHAYISKYFIDYMYVSTIACTNTFTICICVSFRAQATCDCVYAHGNVCVHIYSCIYHIYTCVYICIIYICTFKVNVNSDLFDHILDILKLITIAVLASWTLNTKNCKWK